MRYRMGPRTDPWGTPVMKEQSREHTPWTLTLKVRSIKYDHMRCMLVFVCEPICSTGLHARLCQRLIMSNRIVWIMPVDSVCWRMINLTRLTYSSAPPNPEWCHSPGAGHRPTGVVWISWRVLSIASSGSAFLDFGIRMMLPVPHRHGKYCSLFMLVTLNPQDSKLPALCSTRGLFFKNKCLYTAIKNTWTSQFSYVTFTC